MGKAARNIIATTVLAGLVYAGATGTLGQIAHNPNNIYNDRSLTITDEEKDLLISNVENSIGYDVSSEKEDDYLLLNAILVNNYLSDEEKITFFRFGDMFYDNPYLDREKTYNNLRKVKIDYTSMRGFNDRNVMGNYDYKENVIRIYDNSDSIMGHEIIHCIYNIKPSFLDKYFSEGMTELLYNEYFEENPFLEVNSYPLEISAVKMLCDVCGSDIVLEAFSKSNMRPIINELANYSSKKEAKDKLYLLDELMTEYEEKGTVTHYVEYEEILDYLENIISDKYGTGGFEHNSFKYNRKLFSCVFSDNPLEDYLITIGNEGIGEKAYFSEKLKNDYYYFDIEPCNYTFSMNNKVYAKN